MVNNDTIALHNRDKISVTTKTIKLFNKYTYLYMYMYTDS